MQGVPLLQGKCYLLLLLCLLPFLDRPRPLFFEEALALASAEPFFCFGSFLLEFDAFPEEGFVDFFSFFFEAPVWPLVDFFTRAVSCLTWLVS